MKTLADSFGADIEATDSSGKTALLLASSKGHETVVQLLLENGQDTEAKDSNGKTALLLSSMYGHEAVVRLLLEKGGRH
jgi:ankyrin repeat protein